MTIPSEPVLDEPPAGDEERSPMFEAARKVLLAAIGLFALAQDEIEEFVNRLVERGEIAEKDGRKLVQEVMDRRKGRTGKVEDRINRRVEDMLVRMNVPTKADIDSLSAKIASLSNKIDELKKGQD